MMTFFRQWTALLQSTVHPWDQHLTLKPASRAVHLMHHLLTVRQREFCRRAIFGSIQMYSFFIGVGSTRVAGAIAPPSHFTRGRHCPPPLLYITILIYVCIYVCVRNLNMCTRCTKYFGFAVYCRCMHREKTRRINYWFYKWLRSTVLWIRHV